MAAPPEVLVLVGLGTVVGVDLAAVVDLADDDTNNRVDVWNSTYYHSRRTNI